MKMKRERVFMIAGVILAVVIVAVSLFFVRPAEKTTGGSGTPTPGIPISYANIEEELPNAGPILALPEGAVILMKFYHFDDDTRIWEKEYTITKGNVVEGATDNPDITLVVHSKYLDILTTKNFCSVVAQANKNGDLGMETELSTIALAWKFRSMSEYRKCLGIGSS